MSKALTISRLFSTLWEMKAACVLRLAKYLPYFGWQLTLVTKHPQHDFPDLELLSEIIPKRTMIQGSHSFEPAAIFEPTRSRCERLRKSIKKKVKVELMILDNPGEHWRITRFNNLILITDGGRGWCSFGFFPILASFKRNAFDLTHSICAPSTSSPIRISLEQISDKPCVVDLIYVWVLNQYLRPEAKLRPKILWTGENSVITGGIGSGPSPCLPLQHLPSVQRSGVGRT